MEFKVVLEREKVFLDGSKSIALLFEIRLVLNWLEAESQNDHLLKSTGKLEQRQRFSSLYYFITRYIRVVVRKND